MDGSDGTSPTSRTWAVTGACDSKDGLVDGVLEDPPQCAFDPAVLACKAGQGTDACLTPAQVEAMLFAQGECQGCANWEASGASQWNGGMFGVTQGAFTTLRPNAPGAAAAALNT